MNGLLSNPLLAFGSGLLQAAGPSTNPADVGLGRGLALGLGNMSQLENQAFQRRLLEDRLKQQQQEWQWRQQERQAGQAASAQQTQLRGLLSEQLASGDVAGARGTLALLGDTGAATKGILDAPKDDSTSAQREYAQAVSQGFGGTFLDYQKALAEARRTSIVNNVGSMKPPAGFSWDPANPGSVTPIPGGPQDPSRMSPGEARKSREDEKAAQGAASGLTRLIDFYKDLGSKASSFNPGDRAKAAQARRELAVAIARKRDPGGRLTDADVELAMEDVPDAFGPVDAWNFDSNMENLRKLLLGGNSAPGGAMVPPGFVEDK